MNVAVQVEFKADRKEPLGDLVRRVAAQFERTVQAPLPGAPAGLRPVQTKRAEA